MFPEQRLRERERERDFRKRCDKIGVIYLDPKEETRAPILNWIVEKWIYQASVKSTFVRSCVSMDSRGISEYLIGYRR